MKARLTYIFQSTKGLILLAIAMISIVTAVFGMLSGPLAEWGLDDFLVSVTGMQLVPAEREGRIIMLYHSIALAVVAIETYMITSLLTMKNHERTLINGTIAFGYLLTMICGLTFAYFGQNFILHGLFLFGNSLVFFAGLLLALALWPWREEYRIQDGELAETRGGIDLERVAFFTMAVATLGSSLFGAVTGSYWGNGHETFLAEDLIREPHKTYLQKSIIGHLHIMLTLIGVAITLIVGRWQGFKGRLHKLAMPMMILGTIVISLGAWSVVLFEWAHWIIYGGSVLVMMAALFFVIFSWDKLIRTGMAERKGQPRRFEDKLRALLRDPLRFGVGWQMVFMNFTVSGIGIFMAVKLDEIFRVWPAREERIELTGHWHILSAIIATIILFYYADLAGLKGRARRWFGWLVIIGSDLAFGAITVFEMKRLFVSESLQQPVVNWTMLLSEIGLAIVLILLAAVMAWRLIDLFKRSGQWKSEAEASGHAGWGPESRAGFIFEDAETHDQEVGR
jgi:hypothetical protein